jgi:hypothetical protein
MRMSSGEEQRAKEKDNNNGRVNPVISLMAGAEEPDDAWLTRRKKQTKRMGELSQAAFLLKAQRMEFAVAVPWGDSEKYDFIVSWGPGGRLLRVQVKATGRLHHRCYEIQPIYTTRLDGKKAYTPEEIDVLAAHVQPRDVWYLLPIGALAGAKSLTFYPDTESRNPQWEEYREAWDWLKRPGESAGRKKRR